MIKLFESTATSFDTLGLGNLTDCIGPEVVEERNGVFELSLEYPIDGIHYSEIKLRNIIVCKSNPFSTEQAFRIYYMSKPINGIVTINAEHISYDMSGISVSPFTATGVMGAFDGLKNNSLPACPFNFYSDKIVDQSYTVKVPSTLRSLLGGTDGSILDVFGTGEYEFDNYNVRFLLHRGNDRGVTLRYGKNLTDLQQEENCSNVYTAVYPYWSGTKYEDSASEDVLVTLPEKLVNVPGTFNFSRVLTLELNDRFENMPTEDQLRAAANAYISENDIGKPKVSLKVSFLQLEQAEEYEQLRLLESVYLCDTVTVLFPELGVESTAKCIKTVYDPMTDKYTSLEFGDSKTNLSDTIANQSFEIANVPTSSILEQQIEKSTRLITGGLGGYVILHSSSGQKQPDEILILEPKSKGDYLKSDKIWRWNYKGLGYSNNGYDGPFETAINMDGEINANFILAGILSGNLVRGGTIEVGGTGYGVDGAIVVKNAAGTELIKMDKNGMTLSGGQTISWNSISPQPTADDIAEGATNKYFTTAVGDNWIKTTTVTTKTLQVLNIKNSPTDKDEKDAAQIDLTSSTGTKLLFGTAAGYPNGCNIMIRGAETGEDQGDDGFGVMAHENHGTPEAPVRSGLWQHHHTMDYYWYDVYYGTGHWGKWRDINFRSGALNSYGAAVSQQGVWRFMDGSDERIKDNIKDISTNLIRKLFKALKFKVFEYKGDQKHRENYGLIAQEVEKTFDELGINKSMMVSIGDDGYYTLCYEHIDRFCIPAVHDLYEICENQQKEIDLLKQQIKELREEIK